MRRLLVSLITSLLSPTVVFVNGNDDWHMGGWRHMMWFGYAGGLMWIVLLVLIAVVVYLILKSSKSSMPQDNYKETPLEILKKRYANGEISRDEFEKMKRDIED
jgi:putative membrane protein